LAHPCIKSFAMSLSKFDMQWNRVGLRWSRQRTIDPITILNHYYSTVNTGILSAGAHAIKTIPRDYLWDTYGNQHYEICEQFGLDSTNIAYVVRDNVNDKSFGINSVIHTV